MLLPGVATMPTHTPLQLVEMLEDKLQGGSLIKEYARIPKIRVVSATML